MLMAPGLEWCNSSVTALKHVIHAPNDFFKNCWKPDNYQFYLPNFLKFCDCISYKLLKTSQFKEKFLKILEWSTLQK